MKIKVFPLDVGGSSQDVEQRIEKEGNRLLSAHPNFKIEHTVVIPTSSGKVLLTVFYSEPELVDTEGGK